MKIPFPYRIRRTESNHLDDADISELPAKFEDLDAGLEKLGQCLSDYQAVIDDGAVQSAIESFQDDIKVREIFVIFTRFYDLFQYWCSCLRPHTGQPNEEHVQRYVHELMAEFGRHLHDMALTLSTFIDTSSVFSKFYNFFRSMKQVLAGIPAIRLIQERRASYLKNISTLATFFSAVTATILSVTMQPSGSERTLLHGVSPTHRFTMLPTYSRI